MEPRLVSNKVILPPQIPKYSYKPCPAKVTTIYAKVSIMFLSKEANLLLRENGLTKFLLFPMPSYTGKPPHHLVVQYQE